MTPMNLSWWQNNSTDVHPAAGGQEVVRDGTQAGADHDADDRLPESHTVGGDGEDADEDRGELEVGRGPRAKQLSRIAVSILEGDELVASGFDRYQLVAVGRVGQRCRLKRSHGPGCLSVVAPALGRGRAVRSVPRVSRISRIAMMVTIPQPMAIKTNGALRM